MPDQEKKSSVETVDPLDDGLINSANENQIVKFPSPGKADVILRWQGERNKYKITEIM